MPKHVEAVAVTAGIGEPTFDLERVPGVLWMLDIALDLSPVIREYEIEFALGAIDPPLLECVEDNGGEGNVTLSRFGLRRSHTAPGVCTLT